MKYLFIIPVIFLFSCNESAGPPKLTDKLKEHVSEKIKAELKNPSSYSSVEWSELDTLYNTPDENGEYARMQSISDSLDKVLQISFDDNTTIDHVAYAEASKMRKEISDKMHRWSKNMPRVIDGWWLNHKFKTLDSAGVADILTYNIRFDKEMQISEVRDISRFVNAR